MVGWVAEEDAQDLILTGSSGAFSVVALAAELPIAHKWDELATVWLQRVAVPADAPTAMLVRLGNPEILIPAVVLIGSLLLVWNRRLGIAALWFAGGLAGASLIAYLLKHLIVHPGPPEWLHGHRIAYSSRHGSALGHHASVLSLHVGDSYSLPSGHTVRATLLARKALRAFPWAAALLVMSMMGALVYRGAHWPSDVLGGLLLGWALSEAGTLVESRRSRNTARRAGRGHRRRGG